MHLFKIKDINNNRSERYIWLDTLLTLLTLEIMAYFYYGLHSAALAVVCLVSSLAAEFVCLRLMNRPFTADDLTVTTDALIISMMLPAVFDYAPAAIGCVFAVAAAKNLFGGRTNMLFSPAAAAYVFLYTSWKGQVLLFQQPHDTVGIFGATDSLVNSASHVFNTTGKFNYSGFELIMGNFPGPSGSVCILLLLIAAVILLFRRDISVGTFIGTMIGYAVMSAISPCAETFGSSLKLSVCTNMVLFAAVYIVSDRRIAPQKNFYAVFYGFFVAVVAYVITATSAKENAIVIVSVLFTPIALGLRNLENKIDLAKQDDVNAEMQAKEVLTDVQ